MKFTLKLLVSTLLFLTIAQANSDDIQKVSLQLLWKHQFEFAGFYMAKEKGFYKDAGFDVEFVEYENRIDIIKNVIEGKSDFGITYSEVVIGSSNMKDIVVLAAILQSSPHVLLTLKSSNIKSIQDFKNKRIMMSKPASESASFIAMLRSNGLSLGDMQIVEPSYDIKSLINKDVDIITAYSSNEPYELQRRGIRYNIWDPKDYGFDLYNDILFTSKKMLQEEPQKVDRFRDASLKGWEYAFLHIDETIELILQRYNSQHKTRDALLYEAYILKDLAYQNNKRIGNIDISKAQRIVDIYNILGLIKHPINVETIIYTKPSLLKLSQREKEYLEKKKIIRMCIDPNFMPYEQFENGKHIGIAADYFDIFRKFLKTDIEVVPTRNWNESLSFAKEGKCDILSMLMKTPSREKYLNFTDPYLKIPIVMATRMNTPFVADFTSLEGESVGVPKGYAFIEILKANYPNLKIVEVKDIEDGLKRVKEGELYGYVGTLATIAYAFQKNFTGELKIAGKFDGTWDMRIGICNDDLMLLEIFQKAIRNIDQYTKEKILNNWLYIKYEKGVDYEIAKKLTIVFLFILMIILFFYLKLTKLKKKLEYLASKDPLTDLYNRRYFTKISENIFHLAIRNQSKFSILMIDIDDFKSINDTYGHKVGDDVIRALSSILKQHSRASDIVCRFGGEEFILLLPDTNKEGAFVIAQKIRRLVEELRVGEGVSFSVSIGVSELNIEHDRNIEDVIKRADDALYSAKNSGKNRVVKV